MCPGLNLVWVSRGFVLGAVEARWVGRPCRWVVFRVALGGHDRDEPLTGGGGTLV